MRSTALALALFVAGPASAGDFALLDPTGITGAPDHFAAAGVAAPSAAADSTTGELLVAYETALGAPDAICPTGIYAVGIASTLDGETWSHTESPVLGPSGAFPCGVRAPAITVSNGGQVNVFGEIAAAAADCDGGCPADLGIVEVELEGLTPMAAPRIVVDAGGSPTVIRLGDTEEMIFTLDGDLYGASRRVGGAWSVDASPSLHAGVSDWNNEGLSSPSLSCADGGDYAWELHYTGVGYDDRGYTWAWGSGVSDSGDFWFIDPSGPYLQRRSGDAPDLSVVRTTDGGRVVFVELPSRGGPVIAIASDTPTWRPSRIQSLHCEP